MSDLLPISLQELAADAGLLTRTDRKYVVRPGELAAVVSMMPSPVRVLDIEGRRSFGYESVYFDTLELTSYLGAARKRRHRWKVRTRTYLDSGQCMLEVKVRNGRDQTVKHRMEYAAADARRLTENGRSFVAELVDLPGAGRELWPVLTTRYTRTTFVMDTMRMTVDADLECTRHDGALVRLPELLIVETKSAGPASAVDRLLWAGGNRPLSISKYAVGMAALDPALPANKWMPVLRRHFGRAALATGLA